MRFARSFGYSLAARNAVAPRSIMMSFPVPCRFPLLLFSFSFLHCRVDVTRCTGVVGAEAGMHCAPVVESSDDRQDTCLRSLPRRNTPSVECRSFPQSHGSLCKHNW